MPPSGRNPQSNSGRNNSNNGEPYYSNEDVAILHDIVSLAQVMLPGLPERERLPTNALFASYYDILPRIGINADHDSRYARVLFKIGGLRGPASLGEKFEEVLGRMGIQIEYGSEENDSESGEVPRRSEAAEPSSIQESPESAAHKGGNRNRRGHQRRNSESSAWDLGNGPQSRPRTRPSSVSSQGRVQIDPDLQFTPGEVPGASPAAPPSARPTSQPPRREDSPHSNIRTWLNENAQRAARSRGTSVSSHPSMHIHRQSPQAPSPPRASGGLLDPRVIQQLSAQDEPRISETTAVDEGSVYDYDTIPEDELEESTMAQIYMQAFGQDPRENLPLGYGQHMIRFIKRRLENWRQEAVQLKEDNYGLDLLAIDHDKKALLRSAFDTWRFKNLERRNVQQTEEFFEHLEHRAEKARDLYVLHVAFTHWTSCSNEHVERTALARRHIVRTRIFNAWRDITAVNELKVRRNVLKKFFGRWKDKFDVSTANSFTAVQKYEENLGLKGYKEWLRRLWEMQATTWRTMVDRQRYFHRWIQASRHVAEINRTSEEADQYCLAFHALKGFRERSARHAQQDQQADNQFQATLLRNHLRKWRKETRVLPARKTVQTDIATRRLRSTFDLWRFRTQQEREAAAIDRLKIAREAWVKWRLALRGQITLALVDRRRLNESIYMWTLNQRAATMKRNLAAKRLREVLHVWQYRSNASCEQRWTQEDAAQSFVDHRTQNQVLRHWYSSMESRQRQQVQAIEYHTPRLLHGILSNWSSQAKRRSKLNEWARDAQFYTLTSKALRRWRASTESAKREKRKAAFIQVKWMVKRDLVQIALRTWQGKAQRVMDLEARALEISQNRNVIIGMNIYDRWRARAEEVAELETFWREGVLRKKFNTWRNRSNAVQALGNAAIASYEDHRQGRALKKWRLTILQHKSQSFYAEEVCESNAKRTFRKMLTYWHQKAMQRRPVVREEEEPPPTGATARAEAWSDFGDEDDPEVQIDELARQLNDANLSTPIPGYLSTPSKRSERVMAVAARYSTTPKAPLSTPFERRLRAEWSGGMLSSSRRPPGRSRLGLGEGFADIREGSAE